MFEAVDRVMKNKRGGAVPRRTQIAGQDHMLSYITPTEAEILMQLGGSGEPGPAGIPAFPPDSQSGEGANVGPDNSSGGGREDSMDQPGADNPPAPPAPDVGGGFGFGLHDDSTGQFAYGGPSNLGDNEDHVQALYNAQNFITTKNPYGKDGFWTRVFGIDPSKISYENIMDLETRSSIANNQFSKFVNPTNTPGKIGYNPAFPTAEQGFLRSGVQKQGFKTVFGPVQEFAVKRSPMDMAVLSGIGALGLPGLGISFLANQLTNKTYGLKGMPPPNAAPPGEPQTFAGQAFAAGKQAIGDFYNAAKEAIGDLADFLSPEQAETVAKASKAEQDRIRAEIEQGIRQGVSSPKMDDEEAFSGRTDVLMDVIKSGTTPAEAPKSGLADIQNQMQQTTEQLGLASLGTMPKSLSEFLDDTPVSLGSLPQSKPTLDSLVDSLQSGRGVSSPSEIADMLGTAGTTGGTGTFSGGFGSGEGPDERIGDGPPPDTDNPYLYDPTTTGGYYDYGTFGPYDDRVVIPTEEVLKERFNLVI